MERRRWWSPPRPIAWLLLAYFLSALCIVAFPGLISWLALVSPTDGLPTRIWGFVTYPLVIVNLNHWGEVALLTWLPAVVLTDRLTGADMLLSLAVGSVVGGVAFVVMTPGTALVGGGLAAWGLVGASVAVGFRDRAMFRGWRRIYLVVATAVLLTTPFVPNGFDRAILAAAVAGGVVGLVRARVIARKKEANFA